MLIDPTEPKKSFTVSFSQDFREDLAGAGVKSLVDTRGKDICSGFQRLNSSILRANKKSEPC